MTAPTRRKLVSILIPAFNEEENVRRAHDEVARVFATIPQYDYEIIFTDNHSTDRTFAILKELAAANPRVRVIRFARNYGYQRSVLVAYQAARGDCSVQVDCDLQDPPALIPQMLTLWENEGHEVVYGVRRSLKDSRRVAFARRAFYRLIRALSEDDLPIDAGEFRLVDRKILDELRKVDDTSPYVRGLISAMGFSQAPIDYDRGARVAGTSKFPWRAMVGLAVDGILNHSLVPLRIASLVSLVIGATTFIVMFVYLIGRLFLGQEWPAGFATTTILLLMSITLNAMFLGIMGEYLGRVFMQSKRRLIPIVEARLNCAPDLEPAPGAATPPPPR